MSSLKPSFMAYYDDYKHKVYSFFFYRLNQNEALAEDLTSDTFVKAFEKFESYNNDYQFSTWIYTIARNTLTDHFRTHKEMSDIEEAENHADGSAEENKNNMDTNFMMRNVQNIINTLPPLQKNCIIMKYLEEMSTTEIAEILGESPENVRQAISRGIKKLRAFASTAFMSVILFFVFPL